MSVQSQIDRINSAKTAIGAAIAGKGVTVPSGTKIDGMAALIGAIEAGGGGSGGGTHENCIPYEEAGVTFSVDAIDGAQYGFALNSAGYYESQNKGVNTSYALCRVNLTVNKACNVEFSVINFAESNYDYGLFGALDTALNKNASEDSGAKKSFKSEHSANAVSLVYENVPAGSHFIDVKFIKDSSQNKGNDSLQFKVIVDDAVTISPEYYPIISRTDPVIDTLAAISDKGVNTAGAGFGELAGLVENIQAGGGAPNGREWTKTTGLTDFYAAYYADGLWVAGASTGICYSEDAIDWTQSNITSGYVRSVLKVKDTWFVGTSDNFYQSKDGKTWTAVSGAPANVWALAYGKGVFVAVNQSGYIYYTEDMGTTWVGAETATYKGGPVSLLYDPECDIWLLTMESKGKYYSYDGKTWTASGGNYKYPIIKAFGLFVTVNSNKAVYSADGITWTTGTGISTVINRIASGNGLVIASTETGIIYYSTDGKAWNKYGFGKSIGAISYANGIWVLGSGGSNSHGLWYSNNGLNWTQSNITSGMGNYLMWANGVWITRGYYSKSFD